MDFSVGFSFLNTFCPGICFANRNKHFFYTTNLLPTFIVPQSQYPGYLKNVRGLGSLCAVDMPDAATRDKIMLAMRNKGQFIC